MSFSPTRLNHAVLFVTDLERSLAFYTGVFRMEVAAREPRANAAFLRLPRWATTTTSACSASAAAPRPDRAARSASTTSPGSSTRSTSWPTPGARSPRPAR